MHSSEPTNASHANSPKTQVNKIIHINVSGTKFETTLSVLRKFPTTLLGSSDLESYLDCTSGDYFFDRHRQSFEAIMYFYQTGGLLHVPCHVDPEIFRQELHYFKIHDLILKALPKPAEKKLMELPKHKNLQVLWKLLEYPQSSAPAKFLAVVEIVVIVLAVASFCIETLPQFHESIREGWKKNETAAIFFAIEASCMVVFTFEFILRVISCPDKLQFCKGILNIIDLITILPFYVTLLLQNERALDSFVVLRVVRLARVFRILKLSRHSRGLITLGLALRASLRELALLFFFLLIGIVLFSSGVYYADLTEADTKFMSILDGFWWAVITMTTVGYGDDVPQSNWGKIVGGMCAVSGVLMIALPVPVIVSNFNYYYQHQGPSRVNQDGSEQIDNLAELWSKGICVVRDGVTPSATQSVLMSAGRSLTLTAAVTLNANEQGADGGGSKLKKKKSGIIALARMKMQKPTNHRPS